VHPLSTVGALPAAKLRAVVQQTRHYSFEFLEWRRRFELRQHWLVHNKSICPSCGRKLTRAWLGTTDRRSFFCEHCQKRYGAARKPTGAQRSKKKTATSKSVVRNQTMRARRAA
jgi:endonuclease-8